MKLTCYRTGAEPVAVRPAPATREWMDRTPSGYAYRCLPLTIANAHGWEILNRAEFTAEWDGGDGIDAIGMQITDPARHMARSHFGSGILTFHIGAVFRTPAQVNLWVMGSPNLVKDAIQPLAGLVETDWSPYSFTMNWKFTRAKTSVRFAAGEPICFLFPIERNYPARFEPETLPIAADPALARSHRRWRRGRDRFLQQIRASAATGAAAWQKDYMRGLTPDGATGVPDHLTKLALLPFPEDGRG
ncbi:MAG: hypothetical protein JO032_20250 [Alphaproteobacteria bacterium]|nr:hypothetical protein [Alphaproteobacteria bacterium]MBV9555117.1 hypothetical protein [Alphaproteobacteria bacterium]